MCIEKNAGQPVISGYVRILERMTDMSVCVCLGEREREQLGKGCFQRRSLGAVPPLRRVVAALGEHFVSAPTKHATEEESVNKKCEAGVGQSFDFDVSSERNGAPAGETSFIPTFILYPPGRGTFPMGECQMTCALA